MMTTAELAARLIPVFEGSRLKAYWDKTGKVWTIGFGHTKGVTEGMVITPEQQTELFIEDCVPLLKMVEGLPVLEGASLLSFGFNCGSGALKKVLSGQEQLTKFATSGGVTLPGLVARRQLEDGLIQVSRQR